jgi:hypothetical protein
MKSKNFHMFLTKKKEGRTLLSPQDFYKTSNRLDIS